MPKENAAHIANKIRAFHKTAGVGGTNIVSETDDRASKAPDPKLTDGDDPSKLLVPAGSKPDNTASVHDGVTDETKPSGNGENVPQPAITTKPDEVPLDKYATEAAKKAAAAAAKVRGLFTKAAEDKGTPKDPNASPAPKPTEDKSRLEPQKGDGGGSKEAANTSISNQPVSSSDREFFAKVGEHVMAHEEGVKVARRILIERAGIEQAEALMKSAQDLTLRIAEESEQRAQLAAQVKQAAEEEAAVFQEILKKASPEERAYMQRTAEAHRSNLSKLAHDLELAMYKQGAMDAAAMQAAMAGGGEPMIPGGDGGLPPLEQIAGLLQEMVATGETDQATAEGVLAELMGAAGGGAPGGAAPGGEGGAPGGAAPGGEGGAPGGAAPAPGGEGGAPSGEGKESKPKEEDKSTKEASAGNIYHEIVGREFFE